MKRNYKMNTVLQAGALIPLAFLAFACSRTGSLLLCIMLPTAILAFVGFMPVCRHRENIWAYFLVFLCTIPVNLTLVSIWFSNARLIFRVLFSALVCMTLLSVEELVMAYIVRKIWKRQYRLLFDNEDEI